MNGEELQVAIDEAATSNTPLHLDPGEIILTAPLTLPAPVTIVGADTTLRAVTTANLIAPLTPLASGSTITGVIFQGAATGDTDRQYGIASHPTGANGVTVRGCQFRGMNNAIQVTGGEAWIIDANTIDELVGYIPGSGYGVIASNTSRSTITNNTITGSPAGGRHAVYLSTGSTGNLVQGNRIAGQNSNAVQLFTTATQPDGYDNTIRRNTIIGTVNTLDVTEGGNGIGVYGRMHRTLIEHNLIGWVDGTSSSWGVYVSSHGTDTEDNTVRSNTIHGSTQGGIRAAGTTRTVIDTNQITAPGALADISITSSGTYGTHPEVGTVITGNRCLWSTTDSIRVHNPTTNPPTGYMIVGNHCRNLRDQVNPGLWDAHNTIAG